MRWSGIAVAATLLTGSSTAAVAAATQDVADKVKAALESVVTATPGLVNVSPAGDQYDLKLDLGQVIKKFSSAELKGEITPFIAKLSELGGGKWLVKSSGPQGYDFTSGPKSSMKVKIENFAFEGTFDEALGTFANTSYTATNYTTAQKITEQDQLVSEATGTGKSITGGSTSVASPNGGVDLQQQYTLLGMNVDNQIAIAPGATPISFSYVVGETAFQHDATGIRIKDIWNLIAWFVARPNAEKIKADQEDLRKILKSALPLFEKSKVSGGLKKIVAKTQIGNVEAAAADFLVELNGFQKDGKFREKIAVSGLKVPAGALPAWTDKLLPTDVTFDFGLSGFDAATIAALFIDKFDLNKESPIAPEHQAEFLRALMPGGTINISFEPNLIKSPLYELTFDGAFAVSMAGMPSGKGTMRMKGFDATVQALQTAAASDPSVQQALGPLMAAKGFAKVDGDALIWAIESNGAGAILINGIDVSKM
jgi:hypothetical protein